MKKISVLAAFFCLLFATSAVFAQNKTTNFAGSWELDAGKSKLPERMRVESMTLNVTQTDKELKVETNAKRAARPEGDRPAGNGNGGMRSGGGMGRGGMIGGGNGTISYSLDGKETIVKTESPEGMPSSSATLKAKMEKDGKLKLVSSRSFDTPNGSMTVKTIETWEIVDDGKGLKVRRDSETPRGTQSSEMHFTKKVSSKEDMPKGTSVNDNNSSDEIKDSSGDSMSGTGEMPKQISKGVLNGTALKLARPEYPPAARAVRASGAVNVEVTFDEEGKVILATAVSGHPLLQSAAVAAARKSKFSPVMLEGKPIKVTGIIVYTFDPH